MGNACGQRPKAHNTSYQLPHPLLSTSLNSQCNGRAPPTSSLERKTLVYSNLKAKTRPPRGGWLSKIHCIILSQSPIGARDLRPNPVPHHQGNAKRTESTTAIGGPREDKETHRSDQPATTESLKWGMIVCQNPTTPSIGFSVGYYSVHQTDPCSSVIKTDTGIEIQHLLAFRLIEHYEVAVGNTTTPRM